MYVVPPAVAQLLRYTKLFGRMLIVEGDPEFGFTLTMDGPTSLFGGTARYGVALAKFLPALLHLTKCDLSAALKPRKDLAWADPEERSGRFNSPARTGISATTRCPKSMTRPSNRASPSASPNWTLCGTGNAKWTWCPCQEESFCRPNLRLVHPDGRGVLVEIVGYWRPEYLQKKFALLKKPGRQDLIVCVSERLNLEKAGVKTESFDGVGALPILIDAVRHPVEVGIFNLWEPARGLPWESEIGGGRFFSREAEQAGRAVKTGDRMWISQLEFGEALDMAAPPAWERAYIPRSTRSSSPLETRRLIAVPRALDTRRCQFFDPLPLRERAWRSQG